MRLLDSTPQAESSKAPALLATGLRRAHAGSAGLQVVSEVRRLAKQHRSAALTQLANRVAAAVRLGAAEGQEPFPKVASEKAYCDDELAKTAAKKEELAADLEKLTSQID